MTEPLPPQPIDGVTGEVLEADFRDRPDGRALLTVAVKGDVRVTRQRVVLFAARTAFEWEDDPDMNKLAQRFCDALIEIKQLPAEREDEARHIATEALHGKARDG